MSIETQLEKLNGNLLRLCEALEDTPQRPVEEPEPAPKKPRSKKTTTKKAPAEKKTRAPRKSKLNYDKDVKPQVLIAIATPEGREAVKELLGTFDVTKAPDIDAGDYVSFLKGIEDIIEKYEDE